jgi:response regulator RpfG family c-di-GMP phosphodiesterase
MTDPMPDDSQYTIMLVDDEQMVVRSLEGFLTLETSYRVVSYCSPIEALEAAAQDDSIRVVVADFMMPEMDGVSFLKEMRRIQPEATRLLLTGYADKENAIRAINEAGLYYYLEKPWDNEHFKLVVRNGVERSALFNELSSRVSALESAHAELAGFREKLVKAFL